MKVYLVANDLEQYDEELQELLPGMIIRTNEYGQFSLVDIDELSTIYQILGLSLNARMSRSIITCSCDFIINLNL